VWFASPAAQSDAAAATAAFARVASGVAVHGYGAVHRDGVLHLAVGGEWHALGAMASFPITYGGAAPHNAANVAAAALAAVAAGVPVGAISDALQRFGRDAADNPGRLMVREIGGVTIVMDYAHNPDGMAALCATAGALPARRRLLLLGQAGNRDDAQLRALGAAAWRATAFDRVIIKDMHDMLRGRPPGEIPARLREGVLGAGAPASVITDAPSEVAGVRAALEWAGAGDLLVLGVHVSRAEVLALMDQLADDGWRAGQPLPAPAP
jgi:cyanophycin synthetase